jgi:RNA polymerase sigma factor (sigma-70 family)
MADDKRLVRRILAGNTRAFESLIEEQKRLVSHIVFRMVSNASDREDICQDVFMKVYQNLKGFHFESKLSTWIAGIAYNTCINYLEKKKIPLFDDSSSQDQTLDSFPAEDMLPDEYAEKNDISRRLQTEIDKMPVHFRMILTLYHLDNLTYNQITEIMQMPEGTIKSYLFRARKLLKQRLMAKYQPEDLCL